MKGLLLLLCVSAGTDATVEVDRGVESCVQAMIESALERGDTDLLRSASRDWPDVFLLGSERLLERRLRRADRDRYWLDAALHVTDDPRLRNHLFGLLALLESSEWLSLAERLGRQSDAARQARGCGDFAASLDRHRVASRSYRSVGMTARALQCDLAVLEALAELNRAVELRAVVESELQTLEEGLFDSARGEMLARLAQARHALGELELAWETMSEALSLLRRLPDTHARAFACDEGGWISATMFRVGRAMGLFAECEGVAGLRGDRDRLARIVRSRGNMLALLGDVQGSLQSMERALAVAQHSDLDWRAAQTALRFAQRLAHLGRLGDARDKLSVAEALLGEDLAGDVALQAQRLHIHLFLMDQRSDEWLPDRCLLEIESLLKRVAVREQYPFVARMASEWLKRGDLDQAMTWAEELVRLSDRLGHRGVLSRARIVMATCLSRLGRHDEAVEQVDIALRFRHGLRRELTDVRIQDRFEFGRRAGETAARAIRIVANAHLATGDPALAKRVLAILDFGRAQSLLEALHGGNLPGPDELRFDSDAIDAVRSRILGPSDVLLAFNVTAGVGVAATADTVRLFELPPAEQIENAIGFMRHTLLEVPDADRFRRYADSFSRQILTSALDLLEGKERVICLADGALNHFPLDLLLVPGVDSTGSGFGSLPFLFRRHTVQHVPCLGSFLPHREPAADQRRPMRLLVLSYAGGDEFPSLQATDLEARSIATQFRPPAQAVIRSASAASEEFLRNLDGREHDILHLAAHAWADRVTGSRSGVRLAPGGGFDGRLLVSEMLDLDLPLELVVVSGCEGAAGQESGAEGVVSVGWGFLCAGARTVMVSTETVEDQLLEKFFVPFYRELLAGRDAADALRAARLHNLRAEPGGDSEAAFLPFLVMEGVR